MKIKLKSIIPITLILLICVGAFVTNFFLGGYVYNSDIESINDNYKNGFELKTIIYKYENNDKEILIYNSVNNNVIQCILQKKTFWGKTKYKLCISSTAVPITHRNKWTVVDKDLKYIFVDYQEDIKDINCENLDPQGTKILYELPNGESKSCWIYIVDETI